MAINEELNYLTGMGNAIQKKNKAWRVVLRDHKLRVRIITLWAVTAVFSYVFKRVFKLKSCLNQV